MKDKKVPKFLKKKIDWKNVFYQARHTISWVVLSAGTIAFIVQNAQRFINGTYVYLIAASLVSLILYFGNKK